jgi:hypothetical protein
MVANIPRTKSGTEVMSKPNPRQRQTAAKRTAAKAGRRNGAAASPKRAEKELLAVLKHLENERDTYRQAIYDWVELEIGKEDWRRLAATKEGLPLSQFIGQLEKKVFGR